MAAAVERKPLASYATLATTFSALFGGFVLANRRRLPERVPFGDVALLALATHKLSRLVAKDEVTSFIRAPVTEDEEAREPKREGMARALGELVTCPYCMGLWIAAGFSCSLVVFPRETRFAATIFSAHALSDLLHAAFVRLRDG